MATLGILSFEAVQKGVEFQRNVLDKNSNGKIEKCIAADWGLQAWLLGLLVAISVLNIVCLFLFFTIFILSFHTLSLDLSLACWT